MSRANAIRKKALDLVRKGDLAGAVREYKRLAEIDQSNPNVFNELGDLYVKQGNKSDAFATFMSAINAYTRVSLHNNAVAVCKKVMRLLPERYEVLARLGHIRGRQGLVKEAESYYSSYLDKIATEAAPASEEFTETAREIIQDCSESAEILQKTIDTLLKNEIKDVAGEALARLHALHLSNDDESAAASARVKLNELGLANLVDAASAEPAAPTSGERTVVTEENIWTSAGHSDGDRIEIDETPAPATGGGGGSVYEYGEVDIDRPRSTPSAAPEMQPAAHDDASGVTVEIEPEPEPPMQVQATEPEPPTMPESPPEVPSFVPPAGEDLDDIVPGMSDDDMVAEVTADVTDEDFKSHYDLGMAYLEMDLLPEAIREFQFAARSVQFQVKSLEMIGVCFIKRNQAGLAIKQLRRGLELLGSVGEEALGLKYNLGVAYEMTGDHERAKEQFEDVYVVDVTFRDVADKVAHNS